MKRPKGSRELHGDWKSPEYRSWSQMRDRCQNPNSKLWEYYGGRGITVCKAWQSYLTFLADMGRKPSRSHSLDRIENDGNYTPKNCRWATKSEQARNRRSNSYVVVRGRKMLHIDAAKLLGINSSTLSERKRHGRPLEMK